MGFRERFEITEKQQVSRRKLPAVQPLDHQFDRGIRFVCLGVDKNPGPASAVSSPIRDLQNASALSRSWSMAIAVVQVVHLPPVAGQHECGPIERGAALGTVCRFGGQVQPAQLLLPRIVVAQHL